MTDHFQRSQLLLNQGRYDLAEKELRQVLSQEPDYASAHGLLAFCLAEKKQYVEALKEISEAITLAPSRAGFHYIHAGILQAQSELEAAKKVILEALRLDPEDADYCARLASIEYDQHKFTEVLKSAEQGLRVDAEHVWCMNMRLLSLLALGRIAEAETEVNNTLAVAPDQYFPHTMKGWVMLHQNRIPEAMQSFREALRIEPGREWARKGLQEALKARNGIYRFILRLELGRSRLSTLQRLAIIGLLLIPYLQALILLSMLLALLTKPIFTLLLCFDPYGKLTLTSEEVSRTKHLALGAFSLITGIFLSILTFQVGWLFIPPALFISTHSIQKLKYSTLKRKEKIRFSFVLLLGTISLILGVTLFFPLSLYQENKIIIGSVLSILFAFLSSILS
jgi:tetratricopeptide (TPR) repeat protein